MYIGNLFQSTPVIANGRIAITTRSWLTCCGFNPRPLLLTGESVVHDFTVADGSGFNPRPLLLTGESSFIRCRARPSYGFQSTPVIANGRIFVDPDAQVLDGEVSIHARYC